jgi:hypothetical protein
MSEKKKNTKFFSDMSRELKIALFASFFSIALCVFCLIMIILPEKDSISEIKSVGALICCVIVVACYLLPTVTKLLFDKSDNKN